MQNSDQIFWTFTHPLPLSVKSVLRATCQGSPSMFRWQNYPLRSAEVMGILMSVSVYEFRTTYTLDDGTGVIELVSRQFLGGKVADLVRVRGMVEESKFGRRLSLDPQSFEIVSDSTEETRWIRMVLQLESEVYSQPWREDGVPAVASSLRNAPVAAHSPRTVETQVNSVTLEETDIENENTFLKAMPKLRDVRKLRSADLTDLTFKLYLKDHIHTFGDSLQISTKTLRLTPHLRTLARRVIRQLIRDKKKRGKTIDDHPFKRRVKRLYIWAIRKLWEEGEIVIISSAMVSAPSSSNLALSQTSLWSNNSMTRIHDLTNSSICTISTTYQGGELVLESDPADPLSSDDEDRSRKSSQLELFVSVSVQVLKEPILNTLRSEQSRLALKRLLSSQPLTSHAVTQALRKRKEGNSMWSNINNWSVHETLEVLRKSGQVYFSADCDDINLGTWRVQ